MLSRSLGYRGIETRESNLRTSSTPGQSSDRASINRSHRDLRSTLHLESVQVHLCFEPQQQVLGHPSAQQVEQLMMALFKLYKDSLLFMTSSSWYLSAPSDALIPAA